MEFFGKNDALFSKLLGKTSEYVLRIQKSGTLFFAKNV